jgi:hypothetical protein
MGAVSKWLVVFVIFKVLDFTLEAERLLGFGLELGGALDPFGVFLALFIQELTLAFRERIVSGVSELDTVYRSVGERLLVG